MSATASGGLIGRLAVHHQLITEDQLARAVFEQGRFGNEKRLGEVLVAMGFISPEQQAWLVEAQRQHLERVRKLESSRANEVKPPLASMPAVAAPAQPGKRWLDNLLALAVSYRASDLHIHAGAPVQIRVNGALTPGQGGPLDRAHCERVILEILSDEQREQLARHNDLDFAYTLPGIGRFRASAYRQQRGLDAVFRAIPPRPLTLAELGLPSILARLTGYHQGLVLLTGPAGCGKTSTLAALVDLINEERQDHIITIEDPIEHLHPPKRCVVNQRQAGKHTGSYPRALRAALREDPDVIVIGELRDLETVSLAISAAETGHLVLATLHTNNAVRTINRLLGVFPPDQQPQIRTMLSDSLRAVVSQRLLPSTRGARMAAVEVLMVTGAVANLIREEKTFQIRSALQMGRAQGMCLLDDSLAELVKAGAVTHEEARRHAEDPKLFA